MISEEPPLTALGEQHYDQPECEFCGRSMMGRTRDTLLYNECDSCRDESRLLNRAGKLEIGE